MYVITVVPLRKGIHIETLSYFSSIAYIPGTLLQIPVRSTTTLGLVTESNEVSNAKTALRAATFSLRKLPAQTDTSVLGKAFIQTAEKLSEYYATSLGTILYNLLAPEIRNGEIPLPHTHDVVEQNAQAPQILQAHAKDRYLAYRSLVRETFAHNGSVLLVVPTSVEAFNIKEALETGITDRIVMLTTASTKTELKKGYAGLADFSKAKLIIATPSYAVIERHDITLMILEHARSPYFKELNRPYLDYRDVLRTHAKFTGRKLIFGDILVRTEEEALRRDEFYSTYGETPKRIELKGKLEIVEVARGTDTKTPFELFSNTVIEAIKETKKKKGNMFLFAARRGLAPLVACVDCGLIFRSPESGAPYSLIRTVKDRVEERWFVCSASGERIRAYDNCTACGSWRLRERGIGIQHVYDELHKLFPGTPIILFDHITARTYKKATFLRDTFYKTKGAILLGTHMAIPYLTKEIALSIVVNMDALLATPTWRLEEENLALLLSLREITTGNVLVQTRAPQSETILHAKLGSVEHFYTEELELRKSFEYPPFSTFIHFTWQGSAEEVKKIETDLTTLFADFPLSIYQNPTSTNLAPIMYGLIRVPKSSWPDQKLASIIRQIHPSVRVVINPDRIV